MDIHELRRGRLLSFDSSHHHGLHVVLGTGDSTRVEIPDDWLSVWWFASGNFTCITPDCTWSAGERELMSWCDTGIVVQTGTDSVYQAICGHASTWAEVTSSYTRLLPWKGPMDIASGAAMLELARAVQASEEGRPSDIRLKLKISMIIEGLLRLQQGHYSSLPLCPGRTRTQKLASLRRLMRIRNVVESSTGGKLRFRELSAIAQCSPGYLLKIYKTVFGETPFENSRRRRHERALSLLRGSDMRIFEVSERLGFESQSAFTRAFKGRFGMTPGEARSNHEQGK